MDIWIGFAVAALKAGVSGTIGNEIVQALAEQGIDIGSDKFSQYLEKTQKELSQVLRDKSLLEMNVPKDYIDYVREEIKELLRSISLEEDLFRNCRYDAKSLAEALYKKYEEQKKDFVEYKSEIQKVLYVMSEKAISLEKEREGFTADSLIHIINSVDLIKKLNESRYIEINKTEIENDVQQTVKYIKDTYQEEGENFYKFIQFGTEKCNVKNMFQFEIYSLFNLDQSLNEHQEYYDTEEAEQLISKLLQILYEQKILLIVGDYGSGKTVLMKKLHQELLTHENTVVFTTLCQYLYSYINNSDKKSLFGFLDSLYQEGKKHYILLDSLDDLNLPLNDESNCLNQCVEWLIEYFGTREDYFLVINSRNFMDMDNKNKETIQQYWAYYYMLSYEHEVFHYVKTRGFTSQEIGKWIETYSDLYGLSIDKTNIKQEYGRIVRSLTNPLFLYIFMRNYTKNFREGTHRNVGYYYYYQDFVQQTIAGKYCLEEQQGAYVLKENNFVKQYQELLEFVAFDILKRKNHDIEIQTNEVWDEEILLGEHLINQKYYLCMNQFSNVTNNKMNDMRLQGIKDANLLNCYFIAKIDDYVFFRDVNILFLLAANRIYKSIWEVIYHKNCVFEMSDLESIQMIDFYPQLMDFVLYRITEDNREQPFFLYTYDAILKEPLKSKLVDLTGENSETVSKILLLYIIFIKTNQGNYQEFNMKHIIKDMVHYNKLYKEARYRKEKSLKYVYSIERYFMGISLKEAVVKRVNLKYFNFQGAEFQNTKFIQCRFSENNFKNISGCGLSFELCSIHKMMMSSMQSAQESVYMLDCRLSNCNISGVKKIELQCCYLDGVTFYAATGETICLKDCVIRNLNIISKNNNTQTKLILSDCSFLNQISLAKMKGKVVICGKGIKKFNDKLFKHDAQARIEGIENVY